MQPSPPPTLRTGRHRLEQADALVFGRITYQMMESAFRGGRGKESMPDSMDPFARTIDAAKNYVASSTLDKVN